MGVKENNAGGRFMGHLYGLDVETASSPEDAVDALKRLYESGHNYIVVDASAPTLLKLSDWAADKDIPLFNIRAETLLGRLAEADAADFLSGLLIGAEVDAAARGVDEVIVVGAAGLAARYLTALDQMGIAAINAPPHAAAAGLRLIMERRAQQ